MSEYQKERLGPGSYPGQVILRLHEVFNILKSKTEFWYYAQSAIWHHHNTTLQRLFELSNIPVNGFVSGMYEMRIKDTAKEKRLLHDAVIYRNYDAIRFLISKGANPHLKDRGVWETRGPQSAIELAKGDPAALEALGILPILHPNSTDFRSKIIQANPNAPGKGVQSIAEIAMKQALNRRSHLLTLRNNAGGGKKRKGRQTRRRNLRNK
jgi:hypothetical protein